MYRFRDVLAASAVFLAVATVRAGEGDDWTVAENSKILDVYLGQTTDEGTELVFELDGMEVYTNQRLYHCVFVNGRIVFQKELNVNWRYIRGFVKLPEGTDEIVAYCGVIKAPERINPHNHDALWNTFARSPHAPFRGRLSRLPAWTADNPISKKHPNGPPPKPDHSAYPYLKPEQRGEKVKEALDPLTGDRARFYAVWGLAISGYTKEMAEALATLASDPRQEAGVRGYAAMGLGNFVMPDDVRAAVHEKLFAAFRAEKETTPRSILSLLAQWGDADLVWDELGGKLRGHPVEFDLLNYVSRRDVVVARLLEIAASAPPATENGGWAARWAAGAGLIARRDKRGIDLLIECLAVREPWPAANASPEAKASNEQSFRQSLCNTYAFVARTLQMDFGYTQTRWTPELPGAIGRTTAWWQEHRETFLFPEARPKSRSAIEGE